MSSELALKRTSSAFLWTRLLSTPFYGLFILLPIIFYKDLKEGLFIVTLLITLKPAISLLAPYWSVSIYKRPDRLKSNLIWANVLKFVPFLFVPLNDSIEYLLFASLIYLLLGRGVIPAWMELIKQNIPHEKRAKVFAWGQGLDYIGIALFPILLGWALDTYEYGWRYLFPITALLGMASTLFLMRVPNKVCTNFAKNEQKDLILKPFKQSFSLLKARPDFARFQWGFMFGGAGLMILQPAYPIFFTDTLRLSYQEMSYAVAFCKGIGFALTSPMWAKWFQRINIFTICAIVTGIAVIFPLVLMMSELNLIYLYIAYLIYGVMQAGSELSWHLSGPVFSKDEDSSVYSSTNILMQGLRGVFVPYLGTLICLAYGPKTTLFAAAVLCLGATIIMGGASESERMKAEG